MKDQILKSAIELLNQKGVQHTSFRDIASSISISDGHVRYYFKTKELLLTEIFKELDSEVLAATQAIQPGLDIKTLLLSQLKEAFTIMYRYRFLFYEAPSVYDKYPTLKAAYQKLLADRKVLFLSVFQQLIQIGFFKATFNDEKQEKIFYALFVFSDSWIRYATIMNDKALTQQQIDFHSEVAFHLLEPYIR